MRPEFHRSVMCSSTKLSQFLFANILCLSRASSYCRKGFKRVEIVYVLGTSGCDHKICWKCQRNRNGRCRPERRGNIKMFLIDKKYPSSLNDKSIVQYKNTKNDRNKRNRKTAEINLFCLFFRVTFPLDHNVRHFRTCWKCWSAFRRRHVSFTATKYRRRDDKTGKT